ncbi:rRNA maturation RNase YbeY [Rubrivirga sp.]|uniref:rRNA maturation RNase YbeY n=1 Tax=Rubrivirga sp. TaxID=1885344 RepID=UPI003C7725AF
MTDLEGEPAVLEGEPAVEVHQAHPSLVLEDESVRSVVGAVLEGEGLEAASIGIILGDHGLVHELNREWLGHDYETDVVSFVLDEDALPRGRVEGEVYVDLDTAMERAPEFGVTMEHEALRYVAHGVLHLCGHDDATDQQRAAMRDLEDAYLDAAGV